MQRNARAVSGCCSSQAINGIAEESVQLERHDVLDLAADDRLRQHRPARACCASWVCS